MIIKINNTTEINVSIESGMWFYNDIKQAVVQSGFNWMDSEILIQNWPQKGRGYTKEAGYNHLYAFDNHKGNIKWQV